MKRRFVKTSKEWRQRLLYAASAIASAFADYCINYIAIVLGLPMFFSVLSSKTGSSLLNYALNRNYVFRQGNKAAPNVSIIRYYCLWVTQTIIGSALAAFVVECRGKGYRFFSSMRCSGKTVYSVRPAAYPADCYESVEQRNKIHSCKRTCKMGDVG